MAMEIDGRRELHAPSPLSVALVSQVDDYIICALRSIHVHEGFSLIPDDVLIWMDSTGLLERDVRADGSIVILPKLSLRGQLVASLHPIKGDSEGIYILD